MRGFENYRPNASLNRRGGNRRKGLLPCNNAAKLRPEDAVLSYSKGLRLEHMSRTALRTS